MDASHLVCDWLLSRHVPYVSHNSPSSASPRLSQSKVFFRTTVLFYSGNHWIVFAMTHFNLLPAELQIEILSYLDASEVQAARTVSRSFRDNAAPKRYQSIVACARYQGLGCFQNITTHPAYGGYVREIIFDGTVFVKNLAKDDDVYYRAQLNFKELNTPNSWYRRARSVLPHAGENDREWWLTDSRWKRYQALYEEQEDLKASGVLMETLIRALENMPSVSSIVYSPHARLLRGEREHMRDLVPVGFICYPSSRTRRGYTTPDHAFGQLIGAIYLSKFTGIRRLKVERVQEGEHATEFSAEMFDMPNATDMQAGIHLFCHLTHIELNMALRDLNQEHMIPMEQQTPSRLGQQLANLAKLLACASELRHLILGVTYCESLFDLYGPYILVMKYLFPADDLNPRWTKLESLGLDNVYASCHSCIDFIKRHRATLRSITFRRCRLTIGFWSDVVDAAMCDSDVNKFVLDCVDEAYVDRPLVERIRWQYEGHLVLEDDERNFVRIWRQHFCL